MARTYFSEAIAVPDDLRSDPAHFMTHLDKREKTTLRVYGALLFILIYLQKIGFPSPLGAIPLIVPALWLAMIYFLVTNRLSVDVSRLLLFALFASGAVFVNLTSSSPFSLLSLLFLLAMYALFIFRIKVSKRLYLATANLFINMMMLLTPIIAFEWGMQFLVHPGMWANIEPYIPKPLLIGNYMYHHPIRWQSPWMQPNAAVFLEVSLLSQFLTLAWLLELALFQRFQKLTVLGIASIATLAGSGPLMLLLCAPFILFRIPRRLVIPLLLAGGCLIATGAYTHIFDSLTVRTSELHNTNSSGYGRLIFPFIAYVKAMSDPVTFLSGSGAGTADAAGAALPLIKVAYEYGAICALIFLVFFIYSLWSSRRPAIFGWALFLFFNVMGGGLIVAIYPAATILLGCLIVPAGGDPPKSLGTWRRAWRRDRLVVARNLQVPSTPAIEVVSGPRRP
jgi:hypothetical protein